MLCALSACAREERIEAPKPSVLKEQPGIHASADVSPLYAQVWIDDVTVGHVLRADGTVDRTHDDGAFAPGEPIHVAMDVGAAPAEAAVRVLWIGPQGLRVHEESRSVTRLQKHLAVSATHTDEWPPGRYRAEVWVGDEKVSEREFRIVGARSRPAA